MGVSFYNKFDASFIFVEAAINSHASLNLFLQESASQSFCNLIDNNSKNSFNLSFSK